MKSASVIRLSLILMLSCAIGVAIPFFFFMNHRYFTHSLASYAGNNTLETANGNPAAHLSSLKTDNLPVGAISPLKVSSQAFNNNTDLPPKYTCHGQGINPPLNIKQVPPGAESIVLEVVDPVAPKGTFTNWLVWNIMPTDTETVIKENSLPGIEGNNSLGIKGYTGPCTLTDIHYYHFKVWALNIKLDLKEGAEKDAVEKAMAGHVIAFGELIGLDERESDVITKITY